MGKIGLVRVDSRLLHGQVVTRWIGQVGAKEVIIIDDTLAKDEFMIEVFEMAAPAGVKLIVKSVAEAKEFLDAKNLEKSIILFKGIPSLLDGIAHDLPLEEIQIGGIGGGAGRVVVFKNITLTKEEYEQLKKLEADGKHIFLQTVPEEREVKLTNIANKF
ncbi:PTS system, D-glucosaminate-specific IIB component [Enterococcus sp. DIV2402]|uniref:PTS system, D-glucosaminate-specific IIB component n=1 Tax=Candidatus Enterococcus lowellii TaxID=2230877 RepID=A0ABZ2SQ54_9ENTE|nr:PTS sugar transporter subunit IIB [Enterococcus sp. DIV2402]MBO0463331.1 PTS sugar transporter subunit IIB [Enterococcus sp. DIV2402]